MTGDFLLSSELRQRNETTKKTNRCERRSGGGGFAENGAGKKYTGLSSISRHFLLRTSERLENVVRPPAGKQKLLWREIPPSCMKREIKISMWCHLAQKGLFCSFISPFSRLSASNYLFLLIHLINNLQFPTQAFFKGARNSQQLLCQAYQQFSRTILFFQLRRPLSPSKMEAPLYL